MFWILKICVFAVWFFFHFEMFGFSPLSGFDAIMKLKDAIFKVQTYKTVPRPILEKNLHEFATLVFTEIWRQIRKYILCWESKFAEMILNKIEKTIKKT